MNEQTINGHHISARNSLVARVQFPRGEAGNYDRRELELCREDARRWIEVIEAALALLDEKGKGA